MYTMYMYSLILSKSLHGDAMALAWLLLQDKPSNYNG